MKEISDDLITRGMQIMPKFEAEARLQLLNSDDLVMWSNYTYTPGNGNCSFKTIFFVLVFFVVVRALRLYHVKLQKSIPSIL